jgi:type VI secretion system protein ImpL
MTPTAPSNFTDFIQFVQNQTNNLPSLIFLLIFFGLMVMLICILIINMSVRKDKKISLNEKKSFLKRNFSLPPLGGIITSFLVKQGWIQVNSISQIFLKGLEFLKKNFGEHALYKLPWYIVLGSKNSGKSTLVNHTQLHEPHSSPDFSLHEPNPPIRWKFFSRGVLIDVAGRLFLNNPETDTDTIAWRNLLILLARYRASRPLNGIVLCISAKDLYGKEKLSPDALQARANTMLHTLSRAQTSLRLQLPVYVVITYCDAIPGFQNFAQELPVKNQGNILGWSSPYNLQYMYSQNWINEAFQYLDEKIDEARTELLSSNIDPSNADGLFVFSKELLTIKENLSGYINRIFHASATHEAPILRGIYFTGNSGISESSLPFLNESTSDSDLSLEAHTNTSISPVFLRDLFQGKIFSEIGIAKPLTGKVATLNRGVNIIRNTTICFTLLGTYGLFNAYDTFGEKKERILPVLSKMSSLLRDMQHLKIDEPGHSASLFDTYARQLLDMMQELQQTELISAIVPASWFSPLHKDLHAGLQVAYQEIVIRTIYVDLLMKARELLQLRPTAGDRSTSLAAVLNPLVSSEYMLLKKYVEGLCELNDMLFKFNNLKSAPDARDLDSLIMYTFNSHLPESFVGQYASFRKVLNESSYPLIDLKPYQQMARQTLSIIYENFLNALFSKNDSQTLVSRIQTLVNQTQSQNEKHLPDLTSLRSAVEDLSLTAPSLGELGSTWMDGKTFVPGKEFDKILDHIDMSPLFGRDVTQYLVDQTAIGFNRFKNFLMAINDSLVDKGLNQKALHPSHGLLTLEKHLTSLFKLSFMGAPSGKPLTTKIPAGKLVYWDSILVQAAFNMMKDFDAFISKDLLAYPMSVQENIKIAARINLQEVLMATLGKAQTFIDTPKDIKPGTGAERMLRAQINDFKAVVDPLGKLLEVLKQDDVSKAYIDLRNLLCGQSQWLLMQIDTYIKQHQLYKMKHDDFDWWDGKPGASVSAFAVRDINDLKHYTVIQRELLISAINDFAKPIVELLKTPAFDGAEDRDEALVEKWIRLTDQVEAYSKKQPSNSLAQLENFILKTLNVSNYKDMLSDLKLRELNEVSGDYLLEILREVKVKALSRSEVLQRQYAIENYEKLLLFFNKNLKGKFPFVGAKLEKNNGEANPEDIREFFDMFKECGDSTKAVLDQLYQIGPDMKEVVQFLLSMEDVRQFLNVYLKDPSADKPNFNIKVNFRVAQDKENGGINILDWYIKTDEITTIDKQDKKLEGKGDWIFGAPVTIGFKWVETGASPKPQSDSGQSSLKVEGATAEFVYDNQWALLWLIRDHLAPKGSFSKISEPNPYVLKFSIPMSDQTFTTVYNSISLIDSSSKSKGPPKIITLPIFPTFAPDLPEKIKEIKDKPVFTDGTIESTDFGFFLSETKKDTKEENPKNEDTSGEQENNLEEKKKEETGEQ